MLAGCSSGGELPSERPDTPPPQDLPAGTLRLPFLVDDYFVPNGCFGDGNCSSGVIQLESVGCGDAPGPVQGSCRVFRYTPLAAGTPGYQGYLGILFQDVGMGSQAIGRVAPLPVQTGAQRVTFWAKTEPSDVDVAFRAGGANNWEGQTDPSLPYKDEFGVPMDVTLTNAYKKVDIDLSEVDYGGKVVSPFGWAIESKGRTSAVRLFVWDVRWE